MTSFGLCADVGRRRGCNVRVLKLCRVTISLHAHRHLTVIKYCRQLCAKTSKKTSLVFEKESGRSLDGDICADKGLKGSSSACAMCRKGSHCLWVWGRWTASELQGFIRAPTGSSDLSAL
jgi:hypothetical protein